MAGRTLGRVAVKTLGTLIENPMHAVQATPELSNAARAIANHAVRLCPLGARFQRADAQLAVVDEVFVRVMASAGTSHAEREGELGGETVVHSTVLRVGRQSEGSVLKARVCVDGRPLDVDVEEQLAELVWDAAKGGRAIPVRLRGRWVQADDGTLRLDKPVIVSVDTTFVRWSGSELLADAKEFAALFTSDDFDRMLNDLRGGEGED